MKKIKNIITFTLSLIFITTFSINVFAAEPAPNIVGTTAITFDMDTNEVIYTKNIDEKVYPASITKLLTAIILAENKEKSDILKYTKSASEQPMYSFGKNLYKVNLGDPITSENVMDGLLLYSGNDFAYVVADNIAGNAENFTMLMNEKAQELGMNNSHFITPNGIDSYTEEHYTSAYDLIKLAKASYENDWVKESMAKKTSLIGFENGPKAEVENRNKLLDTDGCIGGKTGYTDKAGRCLVAIYERDGRHIIGVVMNSEYNIPQDTIVFDDMEKLIDWSYIAEKQTFIDKNTVVKTVEASYKVIPFIGPKKTIQIPLEIREDIQYFNNDIKPEKSFETIKIDPWNLDQESSIGKISIAQMDYTQSYDLYSTISKKDMMRENLIIYIIAGVVILIILILIIIAITSIKKRKSRSKNRRGRRRYY